MQITVMTLSDDMFNVEVSDDLELANFKALCEMESGVPAREIALVLNGRPLHDERLKLKDYGIKDGDVLLMQRIQGERGRPTAGQFAPQAQQSRSGAPLIDFSQIQIPGASSGPSSQTSSVSSVAGQEDPATLRELLLSSPHDLALLKERNPPLSEALLSGSLARFTEVLRQQQNERVEHERERIRLFNADPFDSDAQRKIAEEIRLKNVEHNMETAMEHAPESFGQVVMLYIDCTVNGHPVKAFVDSGAQMTIMSQACAERCNIMRLVDTRWAGIAKGVGTQTIIGRIHLCQIQIGPVFLQCSFSILKDQPMDMLLGLDMLKRHQCIINMKNNELVIGTTDTHTPFLNEAELPDHARPNRVGSTEQSMDEDQEMLEAIARSHKDSSGASQTLSRTPGAPSINLPQQPVSSSASQPGHSPVSFSEATISRLTSQGFSRQAVIEELTRTNGNIDEALAALIAKSFFVP